MSEISSLNIQQKISMTGRKVIISHFLSRGRHRVSTALMCTQPSPCSRMGRREQLKLDKNSYL